LKLKISSAQLKLCTSSTSFYASRSRFPTDTANFQTILLIFLIIALVRSGGAAHTKQPSFLFSIRRHVSLKDVELWLKRGQKVPFLSEICPPQMYPQKWHQYWRHNRNPVNSLAWCLYSSSKITHRIGKKLL
jgi:hypothetical protein